MKQKKEKIIKAPKVDYLEFHSKNPKQIEAIRYWSDQTTEKILYGGAKGGAKSYTGCAIIFADALIYPGTQYFIARKQKQNDNSTKQQKQINVNHKINALLFLHPNFPIYPILNSYSI